MATTEHSDLEQQIIKTARFFVKFGGTSSIVNK